MFKFMVLFQVPDDDEKFENAYNDFLALVERMPYIQRRQVVMGLGSALGMPPYYRILEVYFDSQRELEGSLRSFAGQEAGKELRRFDGKAQLMIAEVYEDGTPQFTSRPVPTTAPQDDAHDKTQDNDGDNAEE
jgi:uncharacterized protein (TIGR02118 family)